MIAKKLPLLDIAEFKASIIFLNAPEKAYNCTSSDN